MGWCMQNTELVGTERRLGRRGRAAGIALTLAGVMGLGACDGASEREPGPVRVVVSIAPLAGVVAAVAPEDAEVTTLIPVGASPHGFQPRPSDVRELGRADVVVVVGLGVEGGMTRAIAEAERRGARVVRFADVVGIASDHDHGHDHGHDHDHAHGGADDPHLWLDPALMGELVEAVERALGAAVPGGEDASLAERASGMRAQIAVLDAEIAERLQPFAGARIVTHHGAFGRYAERYGLVIAEVMRPVESAEPTAGELAAVRDALAAGDIRAVFVEPQFDARVLREQATRAGVPVGELDPLGSGDWFAMMRANTDEIVRTLGGDG